MMMYVLNAWILQFVRASVVKENKGGWRWFIIALIQPEICARWHGEKDEKMEKSKHCERTWEITEVKIPFSKVQTQQFDLNAEPTTSSHYSLPNREVTI